MNRIFTLVIVTFFTLHAAAQKKEVPYVIMISFDGFRHDYVKKYDAPNFKEFTKKGSQAESLIPSFPSKTFPNHYTLVTGLVPGHHGLVDNGFYDPKRHTTYGMRDIPKVVDPYYYGGVSLWELARRNGLKSASYFWVGSEVTDEKRRPDYYYTFNDKEDPHKRIEQTIAWLKMPKETRPHLITLYFSSPDHEGHMFGPTSLETKTAVLKADSLLGDLMRSLKSVNLPVNVILVSDHGMHELQVKPETYIFTSEFFNRKDTSVIVSDGGTQAHIYVYNKVKRDSVYNSLKSRALNFKVYRKEDFPERWMYKVDRAGDLLIEADTNHYFISAPRERYLANAKLGTLSGVHGYDPQILKDVRGIFYVQGPNVKSGVMLPAFQNIHVYPFVAGILGLPLPPIDGKAEVLAPVLKK